MQFAGQARTRTFHATLGNCVWMRLDTARHPRDDLDRLCRLLRLRRVSPHCTFRDDLLFSLGGFFTSKAGFLPGSTFGFLLGEVTLVPVMARPALATFSPPASLKTYST